MNSRDLLKSVVVCGAISLAAAAQPPAAVQPPALSPVSAKLQAQFAEWLRATFGDMADADIVQRLSAQVDKSLAADDDISVILDGGMTADGWARYAMTWGGQFFTFKITPAQCRASGVSAQGAIAQVTDRHDACQQLSPVPFALDSLEVENVDRIMADQSISGTVNCRLAPGQSPPTDAKIVVRTMCRREKSVHTSFQFLNAIPADGVIKFSITPINSSGKEYHFGPTPLVVDLLVTSREVGEGLVASNPASVIIDVQPDAEGYVAASVEFFEQVANILASVQDEASAEKAFNEYKQLALRNKCLVEAMERLPPMPPEREAELVKKYDPRLQAAATKAETEMNRLDQAPYAGPAFFNRVQKSLSEE